MDVVSRLVAAVGLTLLPYVGSVWGAVVTIRELPWYNSLVKPWWRPPNWVFGPVWGILYPVIGFASYLVWKELGGLSEKSIVPLGLYGAQLVLNWLWPPIFFGNHDIGGGLATIVLTTGTAAATTVVWYHVKKIAAYLMYPYLAWLAFATLLNYQIWKDNPSKKNP